MRWATMASRTMKDAKPPRSSPAGGGLSSCAGGYEGRRALPPTEYSAACESGSMEDSSPGDGPRIGYLVGCYPTLTQTFIRREVRALRNRGFQIATFSVRRVPEEELIAPADREEARST